MRRILLIPLLALIAAVAMWQSAHCAPPARGIAGQQVPRQEAREVLPPFPSAAEPEPPRAISRPETTPQKPNSKTRLSKTPAGAWMTTLVGLTIVIALILTAAFVLRKHAPAAARILPPEAVQLLGRRYLDQRNCIQLVRCGSRILILSNSAQHGLHTLSEITDPVEVDTLAGLCRQAEGNSMSNQFAQMLGKFHEQGFGGAGRGASVRRVDDELPYDDRPDLHFENEPASTRGANHG